MVAVLGLGTACSTTYDTSGWTTARFDGGTLDLPPTWSADVEEVARDALLSRGLGEGPGRPVARVDLYRETLPSPVSGRQRGGGRYVSLAEVPCPGAEAVGSEQLEVDGTTVAVNVFDGDVTAADGDPGSTVVCATYATAPGEANVQVVLRGDDDALPEGLWRGVLASATLDATR